MLDGAEVYQFVMGLVLLALVIAMIFIGIKAFRDME
jgi:hypothetical protein